MSVGRCLCALWAHSRGIYILKYIHLYSLYTANNLGQYFSWKLSVRALGTRLGNIHFVYLHLDFCIEYLLPTIEGYISVA